MKRTAKIVRVGAEKKGVSTKTGNEWKVRELDIAWEEQGINGEPYEQSANVQVHGDTSEEALQWHCKEGTKFADTRLYFQLSAWQGKSLNNIRCYLPAEANQIPTL